MTGKKTKVIGHLKSSMYWKMYKSMKKKLKHKTMLKGQKVKTIKKTKERNDKIKSDRIHYLFI